MTATIARHSVIDLPPMIRMLEAAIRFNESEGDPNGLLIRQRQVLAAYQRQLGIGNVPMIGKDAEEPKIAEENRPSGGNTNGHGKPAKKASEGAINLLRKVIAERGLTLADVKLTEDHLNPEHFRYLSARDCYEITEDVKTRKDVEPMMTDGQRDLLAKLAIESGVPAAVAQEAWENLQKKITKDQASAMIDRAIAAAKKAPKKTSSAPEEGFYMVGDDVIKVQRGTTNNSIYVKVLRLVSGVGHEWDYQGNAAKYFATQLKGKDVQPLTQERALEIGRRIGDDLELYGVCWMCGRKLTDEESMRRKVGKICINKL